MLMKRRRKSPDKMLLVIVRNLLNRNIRRDYWQTENLSYTKMFKSCEREFCAIYIEFRQLNTR